MRNKSLWIAVVLALALGPSTLIDAQIRNGGGGGWQSLGSAQVDGNSDHDKINCHGKDTFTKLKITVNGSPIQFDRINVVYGNHNQEPIPFRFRLAPGASRQLDLRGGNRDIAYVEFWYQKGSWSSKPEVQLHGRP